LIAGEVTQSCGNFSYMAQPMTLSVDIAAQGVDDISLDNYDSGPTNHGLATVSLVAENNDQGANLMARLNHTLPVWLDGSMTTTINTNFSRLTTTPWIDGPFNNMLVGASVDDGDSATLIALFSNINDPQSMNATTSGDCSISNDCNAVPLQPNVVSYRYGRLSVDSAYGPATHPLALPLYTEFFNGTTFVQSGNDNCSVLAANELTISNVVTTPFSATFDVKDIDSNVNVGTTTIDMTPINTQTLSLSASSGNFDLIFTPPIFSTGEAGYIPVIVDLTAYPWLQYSWSTSGQGLGETATPTKNATFGQFRGNDRVIYWRERN
jgi:MSHA biogenesis protein MshQ